MRVFESAPSRSTWPRKFGAFLPQGQGRAEAVVAVLADGQRALPGRRLWPLLRVRAEKIECAINRYAMESKRQLDVLNRQLALHRYVAGSEYHSSPDMAIWPGMARWCWGRSMAIRPSSSLRTSTRM